MERILKADLERQVALIAKLSGRKYELEWAYGRPALWESTSPKGCGRNISPRLPKGQLFEWLVAFRNGLEIGLETKKN